MKKNILLRINIFVCLIILLGFSITALISYHSNKGLFEQDVERVSQLLSEGVYHQIDSQFAKPIHISLTMANDSLLKTFLQNENQQLEDATFLTAMQNYLLAYQQKYSYDSVFLVSTATNRYYHYNGFDRTLIAGDPENIWYYSFLDSADEYNIVIDNDEVTSANNAITVFINCKIKDENGQTMGVVGVGFTTDYIQELLASYEEQFDVHIYLINQQGTLQISSAQTGYESVNLYETAAYGDFSDHLLADQTASPSFWYENAGQNGYIITQYIPILNWYLIIDNNTATLNTQLRQQFLCSILITLIVVFFVLLAITGIIRLYNAQIVDLTVTREQEHRSLFQTATEQMYENIYEVDITHNCTASEDTEAYFASLGVPPGTPYDQALTLIAALQIKEDYQEGYINTLKPEHVLAAYHEGIDSLSYDFPATHDGEHYYWVRITARIFHWEDDQSIRMFVYRQDIDAEKQQQRRLNEQLLHDSLSGLYNKAATQSFIQMQLKEAPKQRYAFFIIDIDNFKQVNDTLGHAVGDAVIADFAKVLKGQFRPADVVGRIGGDEFVAFIPLSIPEQVTDKAQKLLTALRYTYTDGALQYALTPSIGIALAPEAGTDFETLYKNADFALYRTKKSGKNNFTLYKP